MMRSTQKVDGNGRRYSTEDFQKLIGMWLRGVETEEIARAFDITVNTLNKLAQRLRRNGIPLPLRKRGHHAERQSKLWTQEEVETLVRMRNERATTAEIANILERTFYGVQGMIIKLRGEEAIPVISLGSGRRRLWDAERLRAAIAGRRLIPTAIKGGKP